MLQVIGDKNLSLLVKFYDNCYFIFVFLERIIHVLCSKDFFSHLHQTIHPQMERVN